MSVPGLKLFLSAVTSEFRSYRAILQENLKGPLLEVKVQEDFIHLGGDTLSLLDDYIAVCDAVIHLIGDARGAPPAPLSVRKLLQRYPDFAARVPVLADLLPAAEFSYTQWEAYLALYHGKTLFIYQPRPEAPKDAEFKPDPTQKDSQHQHLLRLQAIDRWAGTFLNHERLSTKVFQSIVNQQWADRLPGVKSTAVIATPKIRYDHLKAEKLIGREHELARLDRAWTDPQTKIAIVRAWAGVGKTALVAAWLSEMAGRGWRGAQRVFDWSFYLQGTREGGEEAKGASADAFFNEALKFFSASEPHPISPYERGSLLARLVADTKSLLILDGLEPLQHAPGSPQAGQLTDPGMSVLLKALARQNAGLCIVTTREKVSDLTAFYGKTVNEWELSHLTDEVGAELLSTLGVVGTAKERRAASREVKGHALTLLLMGRYLALAHEGDIRQRDRFGFTEADNETQGGHAFRVLKAYETWLPKGGKSGRRQLAVLSLLSLFDRPADPGCLAALRQPPAIAGLTDDLAGISDAQWNVAVKRLEEIGLVTPVAYKRVVVKGYSEDQAEKAWANERRRVQWNLPEPEEFCPASFLPSAHYSLEAHPLLREHFAKQMRETANVAWREGQRRLFEHLQASAPYWPEGIDGLGPLYQAVAHGCLAGREDDAFEIVYEKRIERGSRRYATRGLGAIGIDLSAFANFFEIPWTRLRAGLNAPAKGKILGMAGSRLRAVGRMIEAQEAFQASFDDRTGNRADDAFRARHVSEILLLRGNRDAIDKGRIAVGLADLSKDCFERIAERAVLANALFHFGEHEEAREVFRTAERILCEQTRANFLHSLWGFRYCICLLDEPSRWLWNRTVTSKSLEPFNTGVLEDVRKRAEFICKEARETRLPGLGSLDHAVGKLCLGVVAVLESAVSPDAKRANAALDEALDRLRATEKVEFLPPALLARAWQRAICSEWSAARADLEEAWEFAERGSMPLFQADILLYRARLFRDRDALAEARKLIEQCGYWRRKEELEDAEAALVLPQCFLQ